MPKNSCIMQIRAEPEKSALPICNYSQILYQFLMFTQNLKRSQNWEQDCRSPPQKYLKSHEHLIKFCVYLTGIFINISLIRYTHFYVLYIIYFSLYICTFYKYELYLSLYVYYICSFPFSPVLVQITKTIFHIHLLFYLSCF